MPFDRDWIGISRALGQRVIRRVPSRVKRLVPRGIKRWVRPLLARTMDPFSSYIFPDVLAEIDFKLNAQTAWLRPFFANVGLSGETGAVFTAMQADGYPVYKERRDAERMARIVRVSKFFDASYYASRVGGIGELDPALHYVIVGERMGFAPSELFDPRYYFERYPEVRHSPKALLVQHIASGAREDRRPQSIASVITLDQSRIDPRRETVLIIAHEASRTGAPILAYNIIKRMRAKYNVVALLLSGGDIVPAFADVSDVLVGPLRRKDWHPAEAERLVHRLCSTYRFSFAIANSIDTRIMMKPLALAFVPFIALVHEFASYLTPKGEMGRELGWATQTAFSAQRVLDSVRAEYPDIDNYRTHVLPQGPVELPPTQVHEKKQASQLLLQTAIRRPGWENAFVVLGCGTVSPRKGVDLFVACAAAVARRKADRPIRFVWIGERLAQDMDEGYFTKLQKQITQSGIADRVAILDPVADLDPAYLLSDAFFLSSRLDPLPNVAIDSALHRLPIVCFADCSGIADILATDSTAREGVVPPLDIEAAASLILRLAADERMRLALGAAAHCVARDNFDMERYIVRLDELGRQSMRIMEQRREDFASIENDQMFDTINFLGPHSEIVARDKAIGTFLAKAAMLGIGRRPTTNFYYRRPCPGFHPQIYAYDNKERYDVDLVNPLAHFIRSGKPAGSWSHEVITTRDSEGATESKLRVALHVHFHYPEVCAELIEMLCRNRTRCNLLLTTNSIGKEAALRRATARYDRGEVQITVVPNRGRDIGAFLTGLDAGTVGRYDIVGHLHSKRSLFIDDRFVGERWRGFIWRNLVGRQYPMMDIILGRMAKDPRLGLVFPDDPHLSDWDYNLEIAEQLARAIGMEEPLPPFFNFPIGTMFWARPAAVAPLFELGLDWDSYPEEPAPIDGTILHALERILPFAAQHAGYRYATTHVPGVTW